MPKEMENKGKEIRITVLGNSVAMRVRPPEEYPYNMNYSQLLQLSEAMSADVNNLAVGGATIKNAFKHLDEYIRTFPDVYILNFGVVDACTREVPRWFFNIYNSTGQAWYNRLASFYYNGLIKRVRRPLVYLRLQSPWVAKKAYKRLYSLLVDRLLKETNAIIIGMPINLANDRIEKALPGSRRNHSLYNSIMAKSLNNARCRFIDLSDFSSELHYPDGIHYSKTGHEIVAQRLTKEIKEFLDH